MLDMANLEDRAPGELEKTLALQSLKLRNIKRQLEFWAKEINTADMTAADLRKQQEIADMTAAALRQQQEIADITAANLRKQQEMREIAHNTHWRELNELERQVELANMAYAKEVKTPAEMTAAELPPGQMREEDFTPAELLDHAKDGVAELVSSMAELVNMAYVEEVKTPADMTAAELREQLEMRDKLVTCLRAEVKCQVEAYNRLADENADLQRLKRAATSFASFLRNSGPWYAGPSVQAREGGHGAP